MEQTDLTSTKPTMAEMINDASIDRIMVIDTDRKIIEWNKSCETLTGLKKDMLVGQDILIGCPDIEHNEDIQKAITGALKGYRMFVPSEKGSCIGVHHETHFIPLKDNDSKIVGVLCLMHDVAHRVKAENELKSLNKALARKNKELKEKNAEILDFSQITGQDLKEPLRKIYTFIEMLLLKENSNLSDEGKATFKRVQSSVQRMGMLTDDLLNYSQVGLHSADKLVPINLNHVLTAVKSNMRDNIAEKEAVIESEQLPVIDGYRTLLQELFERIIDNALKFRNETNAPFISITAEKVNGTDVPDQGVVPADHYACISFTDNGIGFEQRYVDRIFRMFQRLHSKELYGGSGMGLASCKKIMELHHGFITAESTPGHGSTFHCFFPLKKDYGQLQA
jgi:PAS domain S-box-containing protein